MFAFNVDVPAGATSLDVDLDFLAPAPGANFTAGASTTPRLAVLSWNTVLLYPRGVASDSIQVDASLRIPAGWLYATALETRRRTRRRDSFRAGLADHRSSTRRCSSARRCARSISISHSPLRHTLNLLSESTEATQTPDDFATQYGRLVDETTARLRRESLSPLRLAAHAQRQRRALRPRASRVERRPRRGTDAARRHQPQVGVGPDGARVRALVERQVPPPGRPGHRQLRQADDRRAALGLRRPHRIPRRSSAGAQRHPDRRRLSREPGARPPRR